jgi:hypothetical protein
VLRRVHSSPQADPYLLVPLLIGVLLCAPLLARGIPNTADGLLHLYRVAAWNDAWADGVWYPRWHTALYQGYGFPLFNFYAPLLYVVTGLFSLLLPTAEAALKATLVLASVAYPLGMYLWARDVLGKAPALVASAAFAFATYRFRELYVQGNYAQFLAWSLVPFVLFFWRRLAQAGTRRTFLGAVASLAALLLAHNISAMLAALLVGPYVLWQAVEHRAARPWPRLLAAAGCAGALALLFWLPALAEARLTRVEVLTQGFFDVAGHVVPPDELLAATPLLDTRAGNSPMPYNFGRLHLALALLGALGILRRGTPRAVHGHLIFCSAGALAAAFMMLEPSLPVWRALPFIAYAEFPTRMYSVAFVCTSFLAGAALRWLDVGTRWRGAAVAAGATAAVVALVLAVGGYQFPKPFVAAQASAQTLPAYERSFHAIGTTSASEYLSVWAEHPPSDAALSDTGERRAVVDSPGLDAAGVRAGTLGWTPDSLRLRVAADAPVEVAVAQFYFPGWRALLNGAPIATAPCPGSGLICVQVPAGESTLDLSYAGTPVQKAGLILALLGAVATLVVALRLPGGRTQKPAPAEPPRAALAATALALAALLLLKQFWVGPSTDWFRISSPPGVALPAAAQSDLPVGDGVRLLGWTVAPDALRQGGLLHVQLYWQASEALDEDLSSFAQLIAGPEQRNYATSVARNPGGVPTMFWNPDYYIVDDHYLRVPADAPPVAYTLRVGLFPEGTAERSGEQDVAQVRVAPSRPPSAASVPNRIDAAFAGGAELLGYDSRVDGDRLLLTLYWRTQAALSPTTQVFTHLVDDGGALLAQADGPAVGGLYPASAWLPGEIVEDTRVLPLPDGETEAAVLVGLYDLASGQREAVRVEEPSGAGSDAVRIALHAEE